jgi:hypothetical protein
LNVGNSGAGNLRLSRGTTANTNLVGNGASAAARDTTTGFINPAALVGYDLPNVTGNQTYAVQGAATTLSFGGNTQIVAKEIQI